MKKSEMKAINNELCQAVFNAEEAIQRVRGLHQDNVLLSLPKCMHCDDYYPCPTIKALDGEQ